ncbi:MAG: DNA polymerase III subunit gamma/tau [bacterium TMED46]|nr:MAG: DNA polymerase III subunit gamma/tau [bacterium TMED46]
MAYKVLSLKWRPQSFKDVVGQNHITQTLVNAFEQDRIAQGYIFTGPRGVGKTTTARILAMALNSDDGPNAKFDPLSEISIEIAGGRFMDVIEIDGASNRGIEEIRGLREQIKFAPIRGEYKVIIIDEVHMLTNQAFNALLRTLEEPPPHGKFIFATTDIHKVPATIISRCQRFDFNRISMSVISDRLVHIINSEGITADPESINIIAKKADGSMRDALSLLDQSISFCGNEIKYDQLVKALGLIEQNLYFNFTSAVREKDHGSMIALLSDFAGFGVPAAEVLTGMLDHIRNIIYAGIDDGTSILEMNKENQKRYIDESSKWDRRDLFRVNQVLIDVSSVIRRSEDPYLLLEMSVLKLLEMDRSVLIEQLLSGEIHIADNLSSDQNNAQVRSKPFGPDSSNKKLKEQHTSNDDLSTQDEQSEVPVKENSNIDLDDEAKIDKKLKEENINNDDLSTQDEQSEVPVKENSNIDLVDEVNIDIILNEWPNILNNINQKRPTIGAIIEDFVPDSIEKGVLIFKSNTSYRYNENMMSRGVPIIEKEILEKIGKKLKIRFIKDVQGQPEEDEKNHKQKSDTDPNDEKVYDRVVELFDGEPIK